MIHLGDITKISGYDAPPVDCIIGGSPCQDLSVAGKRAGLAGQRSGLFMEQIRIVKEMRDADRLRGRTGQFIRPRYMVWENVPGAFSSNHGEDFRAVLEETIRIADPEAPDIPLPPKGGWPLADAYYGEGWSVAYRVLDAQFWGVPQRRRRIALVADFGGQSAPEILFERNGLSWDTQEGSEAGEAVAGGAGQRPGETDTEGGVNSIAYSFDSLASNSMKSSNPHSGCRVVEIAKTLDTTYPDPSKNQGGIAILKPTVFDARGNGNGETVPTITGDHENRVTDYTALVMATGQTNAEIAVDKSPTLNCNHEVPIVAHTLRAQGNNPHREDAMTYPVTNGTVRRLTPVECERLQGFPSGWTDIGEWTDEKGKVHKTSDAARYKALGNSIALPPWKWVLKRLCAMYERDATLGSLFDGIGGFPRIWEQLNGEGTCLWASEIEPFCIAVTKKRFGGPQ